jgi:hypothetical protein
MIAGGLLPAPAPAPDFSHEEPIMAENEPNAIALLASLGIKPVSGGAPEDNPAKEDERPLWVKMPDVYNAPGPWWWENHPDTDRTIALSAHGGDVLLATGDGENCWASISEANMRLIQAAPDLLEALRTSLEAILTHNQNHHGGSTDGYLWKAVTDARAAIAKATGR